MESISGICIRINWFLKSPCSLSIYLQPAIYTMSSIPATINKAINLYSHLISDVGKEITLPGKPRKGWTKYSEIFYDSIIGACPCPT